jgi:hypothetical protein
MQGVPRGRHMQPVRNEIACMLRTALAFISLESGNLHRGPDLAEAHEYRERIEYQRTTVSKAAF